MLLEEFLFPEILDTREAGSFCVRAQEVDGVNVGQELSLHTELGAGKGSCSNSAHG